MELIATSDQQLRHLGYHDPDLAPYFAGVFPSDRLPARPVDERPRGYIVNIDTHDQPGSHWVALWTHDGGCTVMDSFAIPLAMYKPHDLLNWLTHQMDKRRRQLDPDGPSTSRELKGLEQQWKTW